eukprot:6625866-Karenia_brevis.AAC.1
MGTSQKSVRENETVFEPCLDHGYDDWYVPGCWSACPGGLYSINLGKDVFCGDTGSYDCCNVTEEPLPSGGNSGIGNLVGFPAAEKPDDTRHGACDQLQSSLPKNVGSFDMDNSDYSGVTSIDACDELQC